MAKVLVVGGGFAGVVAAESLAKKLGSEHQITLISRTRTFLFYPALVRFAFGQCGPEDITFDIREAMLDRRVRFIEGEVARIHPDKQHITFGHGEVEGDMPYDFLVLALGRRLATERIAGFFENAHHLLTADAAKKFHNTVENFHQGDAVIGYCPDARMPVPAFETAFALSRLLKERDENNQYTIKIVSSETLDQMFGGVPMAETLNPALSSHGIQMLTGFSISRVTPESLVADDGRKLNCDLKMIIPPFTGPSPLFHTGFIDDDGYVGVDRHMRVRGVDRVYAAGDCVSFEGPKMGHMAVRQAEVAAENLANEIEGNSPATIYDHEMMMVIDASGDGSIFVHKDLWSDAPVSLKHSRFWAWAKRVQEQYWKATHD